MFRVKVTGEYVARSGIMEKEKVKKNYEIEGNIPTTYAALSIVKNKLLGPALTKKYPDYVTFLTYHIIEITPLDDKSKEEMRAQEVIFMSREDLLLYIRDNGLKVQPDYYPNLFRLREAVLFAKEDPDGYAKHFLLKEPELKLDLDMAACNPDLFQTESQQGGGLIASAEVSAKFKSDKPKASNPDVLNVKTEDRLKGLTAEQTRDGDMGPMDDVPKPETGDVPPDVGDL